MALIDQVTLAADSVFITRVRQSIIATAVAIQNEATSTGFHQNRARLATKVMNAPDSFSPLFAKAVATDATVQADAGSPPVQTLVTDAHLNSAVSAMWNAFFDLWT